MAARVVPVALPVAVAPQVVAEPVLVLPVAVALRVVAASAADPAAVPQAVAPVVVAAPKAPSVVPVVPRVVAASPSAPVVKSLSRWKPPRLAACVSARAMARRFAWLAVLP